MSTALFCFITTVYYHDTNFSGMWFAQINSFVHTLVRSTTCVSSCPATDDPSQMYWYFYRASTHWGSPKWGFYLTLVQIAQMVVGACVMLYTSQCEKVDWFLFSYGVILYVSFFGLFFQLFYGKHYAKKNKKVQKKEGKAVGAPARRTRSKKTQ